MAKKVVTEYTNGRWAITKDDVGSRITQSPTHALPSDLVDLKDLLYEVLADQGSVQPVVLPPNSVGENGSGSVQAPAAPAFKPKKWDAPGGV